jgi:hypothetical protein
MLDDPMVGETCSGQAIYQLLPGCQFLQSVVTSKLSPILHHSDRGAEEDPAGPEDRICIFEVSCVFFIIGNTVENKVGID